VEEGAVVVLGALLALAHAATAPPAPDALILAPRVWKTLEALLRAPRGARRSPPRPRGHRRSP
jgi:hypothetical protein